MGQHYAAPAPAPAGLESASVPPPTRPKIPYDQFTDHMTPQLINDNYTTEQLPGKIKDLWNSMTPADRGLWDQRYQEQMMEYEKAMDDWKRGQRRIASGGFAPVNR